MFSHRNHVSSIVLNFHLHQIEDVEQTQARNTHMPQTPGGLFRESDPLPRIFFAVKCILQGDLS